MDRTSELQRLLVEYRKMEHELARLEGTKKTLRSAIQRILEEEGRSTLLANVDGEPIVLELKPRTEIHYDETLLRSRLGQDYHRILQPDIAKIRRHLSELGPSLASHIEMIGSPSRDKIQQLVSSGDIPMEAFRGAFQKINKPILFVKKRPPLSGLDTLPPGPS
jgi:hypothetical protein